jgi:hypothetical protein
MKDFETGFVEDTGMCDIADKETTSTPKKNWTVKEITEKKYTEELMNRWITILREKAIEYEHAARNKVKPVSSPDLDDICNEMTAYFTGIIDK